MKSDVVFRKPLKPFVMEKKALKVFDKGLVPKPSITKSANGYIRCNRVVTDEDLRNYLAKNEDTGKWSFGHSQITDNGVKLLNMNKLTFLDIDSTVISNDSMKLISNATNLVYLDLRNCGNVTFEGFKSVDKLENLVEIGVGSISVNSSWIDVICKLNNLESITYKGDLEAADIRKFMVLNKLSKLVIANPSQDVIVEVKKLPKLSNLVIRGRLPDKSLKTLSSARIAFLDLGKVELVGKNAEVYLSQINGPKKIIVPYSIKDSAIEDLKRKNASLEIIKGEPENLF